MDHTIKKHQYLAIVGTAMVCVLLLGMIALGRNSAAILAEVVDATETVPPTRPTLPQTVPPTREPTATPTATATPRPIHLPLALRQIRKLENGSFETGTFYPWRAVGGLAHSVVNTLFHEGLYAARLGSPNYDNWGGCPVGEAAIYQVIDVPEQGHAELHVWYRIYSYDTVEFDYFAVNISPYPIGASERLWLDGGYFWSPGVLWNSGWREAVITLDDYRGQAIVVRLYTAMTNSDGYYNTWTMVDDVSLVVTQ